MSNHSEFVSSSEALSSVDGIQSENIFVPGNQPSQEVGETFHALDFGDLKLLVNEATLGEVVENVQLCPLPQTSDYLLGMYSLRGTMVAIFDMHKLLDLPCLKKSKRVMIVGSGSKKVGFRIEKLPVKVKFLPEERNEKIPDLPKNLQPFVSACFYSDGIWIEWNMFEFFRLAGKQVGDK